VYSQARAGFTTNLGYGMDEPPQLRPLVKVHPATGRPALFIGRHAHAIPGLDPDESEAFLAELLQHACQPPRVYRHHWVPGDVVVWDNRCVLHRACEWDLSEPRVMVHTRVAGDPATESALATA
jgi:alpha-ketoglutarate-dependent taurine dioxygenase